MTDYQIKRDFLHHLRNSKVIFNYDRNCGTITIGGMVLDFPSNSGDIISHFPNTKSSIITVSIRYYSFEYWLKRITAFYTMDFAYWLQIQPMRYKPTPVIKLRKRIENNRISVAALTSVAS